MDITVYILMAISVSFLGLVVGMLIGLFVIEHPEDILNFIKSFFKRER